MPVRTSVRAFALLFGAAATTALAAPRQLVAQMPVSRCLGPDSESADLLEYLQSLVTGKDTGTVATRKMWALPTARASDVVLVTDEKVCAKVIDAYSAAINPDHPMRDRRAYVVRVRSVYVVTDPKRRVGEWAAHGTLDSHLRLVAQIAG